MRTLSFAAMVVLCGGFFGLLLGCPQPVQTPGATEEAALRETDAAFLRAVEARDLERALSFYADDAAMFPPNARVATGREAIRAAWSSEFANPGFALTWHITKIEVAQSRELAYTQGTYEFTLNDPTGRPVTDRGKYVVVWKKQPDGAWKLLADIWNSDQAAHTP